MPSAAMHIEWVWIPMSAANSLALGGAVAPEGTVPILVALVVGPTSSTLA